MTFSKAFSIKNLNLKSDKNTPLFSQGQLICKKHGLAVPETTYDVSLSSELFSNMPYMIYDINFEKLV